MTVSPEGIHDVAGAIQLALGPVFLLTGIAGLLNVMAGRLARIIDRGRKLTDRDGDAESIVPEAMHIELRDLEKRRRCTSVAITSCTVAALLVCMVVAMLFLEVMFDAPLKWLIGALFTAAMAALVVGLAFFLREVHLATHTMRIRHPGAGR